MNVFSPQLTKTIEGFLTRYETRRSAILPVLHAIQDEEGWIQEKHVDALEKQFDLHRVQVHEVLTFYSMYRTEEPKKFRILFCDNIVCSMMGAKEAMHHIEERMKAEGDGCQFSLLGVPCLGVCDGAPAMLVNKDRYLKVDAHNVDAILEKYQPKLKPANRT